MGGVQDTVSLQTKSYGGRSRIISYIYILWKEKQIDLKGYTYLLVYHEWKFSFFSSKLFYFTFKIKLYRIHIETLTYPFPSVSMGITPLSVVNKHITLSL